MATAMPSSPGRRSDRGESSGSTPSTSTATDVIDPQEYARFDKVREAGIARFAAQDQENIRRVAKGLTREWNDADGDGRVSRTEFLDGGDTWLKALDKDGDDRVTIRDLSD